MKVWKAVVKYTTKPLLCQGVDSDMAMAKNSRREEFKDASKFGSKKQQHIAFDDMCKLVKQDTAALYALPASPRCQVVALANRETAPTFALDDHSTHDFSKASADKLLNKCNPFLSGKHRAKSEDLASEAHTVSTDCSTIQEKDVVESNVVKEDVEIKEMRESTTKLSVFARDHNYASLIHQFENMSVQAYAEEHNSHWESVGYGRWVKCTD
ncbi:uncharacterized protein PHALS_03415 [Plasmopara halstedii]|uniref:Uncharacterized protein n=1 Tax=Plasmopara halstedii TaxID=4781 RepID=A0A0P1B0F4_PLAHL|nr:uncharacterized protein PHALS_03415 [Plasmopara halstedii]CEG46730.1 hypothetical protein PHALS_03415 [Plasmopara halstedii]|eukprot:XP_024583099.1 hypothetical protein PHALS_03415 [Plasmopara halstedii]